MMTHLSFKQLLIWGRAEFCSLQASAIKNPEDYAITLVGTQSKFEIYK